MASIKVSLLLVTLLSATTALSEDSATPESPAPATILDTELLQEESHAYPRPPQFSDPNHQSAAQQPEHFGSDEAFPASRGSSTDRGQTFNAHQGQTFRPDPEQGQSQVLDSQQGTQEVRTSQLDNYGAQVQDPGFQREQTYRQETFEDEEVRRSDRQRLSHNQGYSQGQEDQRLSHNQGYSQGQEDQRLSHNQGFSQRHQDSQRFSQNQSYSQRQLENQSYSQRQQENQSYSQRQHENQSYSQRQHENQSYSQRQQENQSYSQRQQENQSYTQRQQGNQSYSQRQQENQSYSQRQQENQSYTQRQQGNQSYSQRQQENQSYSQRQQENQSYIQRQQENQSYSERQQENQSYTQRQQENQSYTQRQQENQSYSQRQQEEQAQEQHQLLEDFERTPSQNQQFQTRKDIPPSSRGDPGSVALQGDGNQSIRGNANYDSSRLEVEDSTRRSGTASRGSQRYSGKEELQDSPKDKKRGNYEYSYDIQSMDTGDVKYHQETRNEGKVIGEYRVKEADGSIRVVKYSADKDNGFQASVEYVTDHDEPEFGLRMKPFARGHGQRPFGHRSTFEPSRTNFRSRGQPGNRFQTSRTPSSSRFRGVSSPSRQDTFSSQTPLSANSRNSPSVQLSRGSPSSLFVATPGRQGAQRFQQGSLRRDEHHSRLPQDLNSFQHDDLPGSPRLQASQGFSRPGSRLGNLEEPRSQALRSEFKNQNNQGQKREQTGSQFQQSSFQNQDRKQLKAQSRDEYQESKRNSFQTQNRDNFQSQENKQFHSPVHGQPQIENNDRFQSQGKDQFDGENRDQYEINRRNRFQSPNRQFQSQTQLQNQGEAGQIQKNDRSPDIQFQAQNNRFHAQNRNQFQVEEESQFQSQERRQFHEQDTQFHPQDIRQFQSQDRRQSPAPESQFPIQERDDFLTQDGNQLQTQDRRQFTSQDRDQLRSQERRQYQTQESHFRTQDRRPFRTQDRNQIPAEDRSQFQSQQRGQFSSQERDLQYNEGNERLQPHTNDHFQTQSKDQLDVQGRRESQVEYSDQYQTQNRGNFLSQDGDQSRFEDINNFQREFHGPLSGDQFQGQQSDEFESQRAGVTATQHAHNLRSRNQFQASRTTQTQSQNRIQSDSRVDFDGSNSNTEQRQYDATERHGTDVKHETAAEDGSYSEEGGNENGNQRYGVKDSLNLGPYSTQRNRASVNIEVPGDLGSSNHRYAQTDASQTGSQRQRTTSGRYASQEDEFQHSRPGEFQNPQENVDIAQTGVYEAGQQYSRTQDRLPPFQEQTGRFPASSSGGGNRADFGDGLAPTPAVRPQFQSEDTTQTFQNPDPSAEDQFYGSREDKEAFRRTRVSAPVLTRPAFQTVAEPHPQPLN